MQREVLVLGEEEDEALADGACGAENTWGRVSEVAKVKLRGKAQML